MVTIRPLQLILFETQPVRARAAQAQGISGFIFDVERRGKTERQHEFDTEISSTTLDQLATFVAQSRIRPICRIDSWHSGTPSDVELAIESGAGELILPMVRTVTEVERLLALVAGRIPVGIMVETNEILDCLSEISRLPLARVYVGLNDLMIIRGGRNLFEPMIDGTIDKIRSQIGPLCFGVAGATHIDHGFPVPFRLLLAEMARLEVDFTFLRRSFHRDVRPDEIGAALRGILEHWRDLQMRSSSEIAKDHSALETAVTGLST